MTVTKATECDSLCFQKLQKNSSNSKYCSELFSRFAFSKTLWCESSHIATEAKLYILIKYVN